MTYQTIRFAIDGRNVARVTLARAAKRNAMDAVMIAELTDAALRLAARDDLRAVVLDADGETFCAGGDLGWMRDQAGKDRDGKVAEAMTLARMLGLWNALPQPVIGQVRGAAFGGGLGLIAVCDTVLAEHGARFALTETRLGLIPATIGPFVVARLGEAFARQVFFTGRPFGPDFLLRAGLLSAVVDPGGLDAAIEAELSCCLECAPGAVAAAKALCRDLVGQDPEMQAVLSAEALADRWESPEAQAGIAAFFDRRSPPWQVRDDPAD